MPKRRRFEVKTRNPQTGVAKTQHILAYPAPGGHPPAAIVGYFTQRGLVVESVAPVRRAKPVGAGKPARWDVRVAALERAKRELGITWPIKITRTTCRGQGGCHRLAWYTSDPAPTHYITADKLADHAKASSYLWHELTHAAQAERAARTAGARTATEKGHAWKAVRDEQFALPYIQRPIEVEARQVAQLHANILLTRPA